MKKTMMRTLAALLTLALLFGVSGALHAAKADVGTVTITPDAGQSYTIPVGGTVHLTATTTGTLDTPVYTWNVTGGANVSLSATDTADVTVTGLKAGTTAKISVSVSDAVTTTAVTSAEITITITSMTIGGAPSSAMAGGDTTTLTVSNAKSGSVVWTSNKTNVATVDSNTGLVTAVGAGTATITATSNTGVTGADVQEKTASISVNPKISLTGEQNLTSAGASCNIKVLVEYGGELITTASTVTWGNNATNIGTLGAATTSFVDEGSGKLGSTVTYTANSSGLNGTSTISASVNGAGTYTKSGSTTVQVRTQRYITIEGPSKLTKTDRYGTYTVSLREANGTIVDDDTSKVHWSWTSGYMKISDASLNNSRHDMTNGQAQIQLYARYNTKSSGTKLYVWLNDETGNKVYKTINITGLDSLPSTGQDYTAVYILAGLCGLTLIAAGVWYGIRKRRNEA